MIASPLYRRGLVAAAFALPACARPAAPAHAADAASPTAPAAAAPLPDEVLEDPLGTPLVTPGGLARWISAPQTPPEPAAVPMVETVAKPLEEFVRTPWNAPAFGAAARPGLLVRQGGTLPFGFDAEWRVGVAVDANGPGRGELADATQWTIRKALSDDLLVYLHDRGSGFVKSFGERFSVFGRYITSGDRTNPVSTVQVGAAKAY